MSKSCTVHQMLSDQNFAGIKPTLIDSNRLQPRRVTGIDGYRRALFSPVARYRLETLSPAVPVSWKGTLTQ
jgi:hypothetical protein